MVIVEKKGTRAIICKSDQTCSALCLFFFFVLLLFPLQLLLKNKTKPILTVKYKSPFYISALIWRDVTVQLLNVALKSIAGF